MFCLCIRSPSKGLTSKSNSSSILSSLRSLRRYLQLWNARTIAGWLCACHLSSALCYSFAFLAESNPLCVGCSPKVSALVIQFRLGEVFVLKFGHVVVNGCLIYIQQEYHTFCTHYMPCCKTCYVYVGNIC